MARPVGAPIRITPTVLSADAYDAGDLFFDVTEIANAVDALGGAGVIDQIVIYDKGDQAAAAMTLIFAQASTSLGSLDAAPNISDANAAGAAAGAGLRTVAVASGDFIDVGGLKVATLRDVKLIVNAAAASRSIYLGAMCAGTPTQATGDIVIDVWMA
ncbi:MAG: hypothetical protein GC206_13420 [Alphaproteobacteria bacterium]|nr:hypothetical protein [Alphaproteobacteria bacterium]